MFTPQEVSEKVFPKASFGGGGYNMASVDEFLDALTEDYTALFKENVTLKAKLKVLAEKVEEYRSTEEAMRQALLTAQKMAAKLVQEAQSEKEKILADAQVEAQTEIHRLDDERRAAEKKLQELEEHRQAWAKVQSAAGLPRRAPSRKEEDAAYRWVYQWKFTGEMLRAAYERCVDNTGKFNISYINKILEGWHKQGARNLQEVEMLEAKKKEEREQGTSYDIDQLEKMSFFDLPEEL